MNSNETKQHFQTAMRGDLAAHLRDEHGVNAPKTKQQQDKLHRSLDHTDKPAQDARSAADASVLAGVTRKQDEQPAANQPKPKPAARNPAVKDVPLPGDSKPATRSKPAASTTRSRAR